MPSPCLTCDFKDEDKNKERCANCKKRIKYAMQENLISIEAVEADLAAREETRKILEMDLKSGKKKTGPKPKVPKEAVTMEEVEDAHRGQIEDINETQMGIDMADLKAGESSEKKPGRKPKLEKRKTGFQVYGSPTYRTISIHLHPVKRSPETKELLIELRKIAQVELRNVNQQALYFIKEGIDKWKENYKRGR